MARYTTSGIKSTIGTLNTELEKIAAAQEDFISRTGEAPNQMTDHLDLNGNKILNLPAPSDPNDAVRLQDLNIVAEAIPTTYRDIRDFGAIPNDPTFDSITALNLALASANTLETVLIEGGVYYFSNVIYAQRVLLAGSGTVCPISTYDNTLPLITIQADRSHISDITFDMLNTASYPLRIESAYNIIKDLKVKNMGATPDTSTSAAAVHLTGAGAHRNTVEGITVERCINVSAANPSIPRCITLDGGASYNSIRDIHGYNIAAGIVHGTGRGNVLDGFVFDNSLGTDAEQRNGIYSLEGCSYFTCMNGVINNSAQPIVDKGYGNLYKDILEIDSDADGVSNSSDCTFDGITKIFTKDNDPDNPSATYDPLTDSYYNTPNGGFIRTRGDNVQQNGTHYIVNNLTIKNCKIIVPNHYTSMFTFDTGTVNNLLVENNIFITENVDSVLFRNIILHASGENPRYIGNTFLVRNEQTPYTTLQSWTIRLPSNATEGKWLRNSLECTAVNGILRLVGGLSNTGIEIDDTNQLRADFGTAYIQDGFKGRFLRGFIPPNSGAWTAGDVISNSNVNVSPLPAFDFQKYAFFICSKSGDYSDPNNTPEFSLIEDVSLAAVYPQVVTPSITNPAVDGVTKNPNNGGFVPSVFAGTTGQSHASSDWEIASDQQFLNPVFTSYANPNDKYGVVYSGLPAASNLYVRLRFTSTSGIVSPWSARRQFFTS